MPGTSSTAIAPSAVASSAAPSSEQFVRDYQAGLGAATEADLENITGEEGLAQLATLGVTADYFPGPPARTGDPGPTALFSHPIVYERGALTLHALRLTVGDEAFFTILRTWTARFHNGNATTEDFIALAEEISGEQLDDFFESWLFEPALPDLPSPRAASGAIGDPGRWLVVWQSRRISAILCRL